MLSLYVLCGSVEAPPSGQAAHIFFMLAGTWTSDSGEKVFISPLVLGFVWSRG